MTTAGQLSCAASSCSGVQEIVKCLWLPLHGSGVKVRVSHGRPSDCLNGLIMCPSCHQWIDVAWRAASGRLMGVPLVARGTAAPT